MRRRLVSVTVREQPKEWELLSEKEEQAEHTGRECSEWAVSHEGNKPGLTVITMRH